MRVGVVVDRWDPSRGGAERALAKLVGRLAGCGHEPIVLTMSASAGAPGEVRRVAVPPRLRGDREVAFARRAAALARDAGCDVTLGIRHLEEVDVYWPHGGLHRATLAAGERSRGAAGSVARALHRLSRRHRTFLRLEERLLAGGGARVVWCVSDLVRREIEAAFPAAAGRLETRPNGVDLAEFRPELRAERRDAFLRRHRIDADAPVLVVPGGTARLKGWSVLRRALRDVPPPWTAVVAGRGADRAARPRGLPGRVVLLPPQDARDLHGAADLVLQPTFRDPCPLATLEALACGVPVVTTSANGAAPSDVPPGDPAAFAAAVVRALPGARSPETRRAARDAVADRPEDAWLGGLVASLERAAATSSR